MAEYGPGLFASNELLTTPMLQLQDTMPALVSNWMLWLGFIAISSLLWSFKKVEARYVLAAFAISIVASRIYGMVYGEEHILYVTLSISHVLFWTPAFIMLLKYRGAVNGKSVYGVWLGLAIATMAISLFFDWRDTITYLNM